MASYLVQFGIATLCIVWIPLGVVVLRLRRKVDSLRATVKALQNQVDRLAESNFFLLLKGREQVFGSSKPEAPKADSAEVLPLKSSPIAPSVVGSR
jgi:hypothetical protein